jgi:two-component system CheB/CheR fusion protein
MTDTDGGGAGSEPRPGQKLLVVGLGASAGGIEALRSFFAHVSGDSGAAYVVILHLSPDHDSKLAEVLQTTALIPVTQVTHSVRVEADHVYVVPPNRRLEIVDGLLTLSEMTQREHRRSPVDVFFRTLADAHGSRSVAIVLSGTGPNGSAGLKRVKEYGGLTIAQAPEEAGHGEMPSNAIATGHVDLVLRVTEMPPRIVDYQKRLQLVDTTLEIVDPDEESDALRDILSLLRVRTGHDFANYKPQTLLRRLQRRLHVVGSSSLLSYSRMIREQPQEAVMLMKDLLISVTHFFRDPQAFTVLEQRVLPRLFEHKTPDDQVRVWVPGCATGEEAYSIGMLLAEYSMGGIDPPHIQVFATDLDEESIGTARDGLYSEADVVDVPEQRLERFFHREGTGYRIRRELREMILFAHHNVIKDPPFSHLDLVSCRNVLIYLNRAAQQRILETFHFALRPGALLMLGPSESPDGSGELFASFDRAAHIYESRTVTSRPVLPEVPTAGPPRVLPRAADPRPVDRFAPLDAHHRLLEQYAPPSLVVTEDNTIVHISTRAAAYLQMPAGEPTRDLLKLVRPELRVELRAALFRAAKDGTNVELRHLPVTIEGVERHVDLTVRPVLREDDPARGFFLVLFADSDDSAGIEPRDRTLDATMEPIASRLDEELSLVKAQLRSTVEQYEAQVEEAQASAEEHQAMNEELRSAAEELETSKEEIQSINEELSTVNQELKIKIEELRLSNNDLQNLINSTDLATIFLDRSLRVKLTTSRAHDIFNVLPTDVGRPLSDITHRLTNANLDGDLRLVLDKLQAVDREVTTIDDRCYLMRIRPYRTIDNRIDGLVLMFQDITARRQAERETAWSEERLRLLVDGVVDYAIFTMTEDGVIDSWNQGAQRMFGYRGEEIIGHSLDVLFTPEDRESGAAIRELAAAAQRDGRCVHERYHVRRDGTLFFASGVTTRLGDGLGFAQIARDLTAPRLAADALRRARAETDLQVASHARELQTVLADQGAAREHVVSLLRKIVTAQEDERGRIARNLHDQLGQRLTALRLSLERAQERLVQSGIGDDEIERALNLTHQIDDDVGFLSWELRPAVLEHLGLGVALPRYAHEWSQHYGLEVDYKGDSYQIGHLTHETEVAFYRVAQEALTNVAKHAHASRVDMMLESRDHTVVLVIEDDGVGFDTGDSTVTGRGVGLIGMRERAGLIGAEFEIESKSGEGTSVFIKYNRPSAPPTEP